MPKLVMRRIKPQDIKIPEIRVTAQFDDDTQREFMASMAAQGNLVPIIVCIVNEEPVLVDGLHRLQECIKNQDQAIDCVVLPGDMVDVMTRNLFLDHTRGKHPVGQMIKVLQELHNTYGLDSDQIRERTGLTRDYIERLLCIATVAPEVLEALNAGAIGVGVVFQLSRLPAAIIQQEIMANSLHFKLKEKDVKDLVDQTLIELGKLKEAQPPPELGPTPPPRLMNCSVCQQTIKPSDVKMAVLCPSCFTITWRKAKDLERTELEKNGEGDGD